VAKTLVHMFVEIEQPARSSERKRSEETKEQASKKADVTFKLARVSQETTMNVEIECLVGEKSLFGHPPIQWGGGQCHPKFSDDQDHVQVRLAWSLLQVSLLVLNM
jgi:hypothetical protein